MNPLLRLSPAVVAALAGLGYGGAAVPAGEFFVAQPAGHYVVLDQPTAVEVSGRAACKQWTCTALVDVVTQFPGPALSSAPADALAEQVLVRLQDVALALPAGCSAARACSSCNPKPAKPTAPAWPSGACCACAGP